MYILLNDQLGKMNEEELMQMLSGMPKWRMEKTLQIKNMQARIQSAAVFHLLQDGLKKYYDMDLVPEFSYTGQGKPVFENLPDLSFGLSHCQAAAICVLDEHPVGVDIESLSRVSKESLWKKCMNAHELSILYDLKSDCFEKANDYFLELWTRKEAYLKYYGLGIGTDLRNLLDHLEDEELQIESILDRKRGFVYSICYGMCGKR